MDRASALANTESGGGARNETLYGLTILRAAAAMLVLFGHFGDDFGPELYRRWAGAGAIGVDIFFILSGFVLSYVYLGTRSEPRIDRRKFFVARFARVYPTFALALLAEGVLLFRHYRHNEFPASPAYGIAQGIAKFGLVESWYPPFHFAPPWLTQGWTISVEAFFYVMFAFFAVRVTRISAASIPKALFASICAEAVFTSILSAAGRVPAIADFWGGPSHYVTLPIRHLPGFVSGVLLARWFLLSRAKGDRWLPAWSAVPASLAISIWMIVVRDRDLATWENALLHVAVCVLIGSLATFRGNPRGIWLRTGILLGEASYAVYLFQGFLFGFLGIFMGRFGPDSMKGPLFFLWFTILLQLLGIGIHLKFEVPLRETIRRRFGATRAVATESFRT